MDESFTIVIKIKFTIAKTEYKYCYKEQDGNTSRLQVHLDDWKPYLTISQAGSTPGLLRSSTWLSQKSITIVIGTNLQKQTKYYARSAETIQMNNFPSTYYKNWYSAIHFQPLDLSYKLLSDSALVVLFLDW